MENTVNSLINGAFSGLQLTDNANAEAVAEVLDKYGLRWNVEKQPLFLPDGTGTDFYGIVRTDTSRTFTTAKEGYMPFQNSELAELLIRISEKTGYEIHSGGMFNDGGRVYLQLNTGNEITNLGNNRTTVKGYVTGINSHDGTAALKWGAVNFTVCCKNTFAAAGKMLQHTARHTASVHARVEQSIQQITGIVAAEKTIFDSFIQLSEKPVKREHIAKIVQQVTGVDTTLQHSEAKEKFSTYSLNRSAELLHSIGREIREKGETLWGLFSGVTHYTSHVMPVPKRENARLESKYTGSALAVDNEAYNLVLSLN